MLRDVFKQELAKRGLKGRVRANAAGCLDQCAYGPTVVIYPEGVWYWVGTAEDVVEIVEQHIVKGEVVARLLMDDRIAKATLPDSNV
jgi:(2Fe-2S) ferredoxin